MTPTEIATRRAQAQARANAGRLREHREKIRRQIRGIRNLREHEAEFAKADPRRNLRNELEIARSNLRDYLRQYRAFTRAYYTKG